MKKVLVMIGMILSVFSLTSCKKKINKVKVYEMLASTPIIIEDKTEINLLKKMIINKKYIKDSENLHCKEPSDECWWLLFENKSGQTEGLDKTYYVISTGYVYYYGEKDIDDENVYIAEIDYQKFLEVLKS